jgi:pimeloyl-ACP methyl ester carboxylesterase
MAQPQTMRDLVVVVPGILGSVLVRDGREIWGASGKSIIGNLVTFGRALKELKLEPGIGHDDPKDGVSAPHILPRLHMIPTFWKADGYGMLLERLSRRFALTPATADQPGNFIAFPYDWRLSNQLNAQRFADAVVPDLERWRRHTQNRDARLILICHSMGGLLARWFLEVLGGHDLTRTLITIGTPYRGSINALDALANGMFLGVGPFGLAIDALVRSFPSVYQLLPTYPCLDFDDGQLRALAGMDLPNLGAVNVEKALEFHAGISDAVGVHPRYQTFAIKGIDQPTAQSARLRDGKVEPLRHYKGTDYAGDGTVPRPSSHPPEWPSDDASAFAPQKHAMLQSTDSILAQLSGILEAGRLSRFMAGGLRIGVDLPDVAQPGVPVSIEATSLDGDPSLPLHVVCEGEDGQVFGSPKLMHATGDGRYRATIDGLPAGGWRITVRSATPARPVEPVSDWTLALNPDAAQ